VPSAIYALFDKTMALVESARSAKTSHVAGSSLIAMATVAAELAIACMELRSSGIGNWGNPIVANALVSSKTGG